MSRILYASTVMLLSALFWPFPAHAQYANWDDCAKSELELIGDLSEARTEGRDLREYLEERTGAKLDADGEYMLWLFETRPAKTLATVMIGKCALLYPDSSPFSEDDLAKLREAEDKAMKELRLKILQQEGRVP